MRAPFFSGLTGRRGKPSGSRFADSFEVAVRSRNGGTIFRYQLHLADGTNAGEATYAVMIKPGEEILLGNGRRFRVLDVVPFEESESSFVGLLQIEAA
jgi:hypothetical protein